MFNERRTRRAIRILTRARRLLDDNRWVTGAYWDDTLATEGFCAIGAVNASVWRAPGLTPPGPATRLAINALAAETRERGRSTIWGFLTGPLLSSKSPRRQVISYNDNTALGKDDILSLFEDAITRLRREIDTPEVISQRIDAALDQRLMELAGGPE